jgi:hypothetical protein
MNSLRTTLDEYLGARRALGHKLILTERLLRRFRRLCRPRARRLHHD